MTHLWYVARSFYPDYDGKRTENLIITCFCGPLAPGDDRRGRAITREENMKHFASKSFDAAFGLGLAALPAAAADTSCNTTFSNGTINGNLVVPNGAACTLINETVTGNVTVGTGAALTVNKGGTTGGNIRASHCSVVMLNNSLGAVSVGGNVAIEFCTNPSGYGGPGASPITISGNFTCANSDSCVARGGSVGGNIQVNGNAGSAGGVAVASNTVMGNVLVNNNGKTSSVGGNNIGGNLSCQGNAGISDETHPNTVAGHKLGQCAGL